ncbi:unnamed protein product [Durusdinium trenchii]|uniref:Uncharacterized protein n=1 Tax=Durusdinium trenchii TaxID=1381693 RepID=A0ABP0I901_9DINO
MTFDDFTNKMLIDKHTKPTLGPTCFAIDGPDQLEKVFGSSSWGETSLSESNRVSLRKYRRLHPGKRIFDLGQTPGVRGRTELQNNELPTLARSTSHLWSEDLQRVFTGREKLFSLGYPVWDDPDFDIESDVEDGELTSWLERPGKSVAFQIIHWQDSKKLVKYLPPGNLKELYQHYVRAALQPLPWHSADSQAPGVGDPVYRLHPSVVASLAPSVPLRAAFGGARHV